MSRHLTVDVNAADFIIDLSNLLRDRSLGGAADADVSRLSTAISALTKYERDANVALYAVADASLFHSGRFDNHQSIRQLRGWRDRGLVEVLPGADERILELAELTGLRIVSADRYRGWRDEFPWLQGNRERVVAVLRDGAGEISVQTVDLGVVAPAAISRHREQDQLNQQGLVVGRRRKPRLDVVSRLWRCPRPQCTLYDGRGRYVLLPRIRQGVVTCEVHGVRLHEAGPRPVVAQVKVLLDGECARRFSLPHGADIPIGRAPGASGINLAEWLGEDVTGDWLSRRHLRLRFDGRGLYVLDTSTNGTRVRPAAGAGPTDTLVELIPKVEHRLRFGEMVLLTSRIGLIRSGRQFPSELSSEWAAGPAPDAAPVTRPAGRPRTGPAAQPRRARTRRYGMDEPGSAG